MSQAMLADGDEFFDECQDWMIARAMQTYMRHSTYDLPRQIQHTHMYYQHHQHRMMATLPINSAPIDMHMHMHMVGQTHEDSSLDADHSIAFDQFLRDTGQA